jgi:hypothetical protein
MTRLSQPAVIALLAAAFLAQVGCGRKAQPRPAVDVLPETITDLEAKATAVGTQLSWSRPDRYTGGDRMRDLGGFLVQRADAAGADFETVGTIEVTDRDRFQKAKRFRHIDGTVAADREYRYQVVSFTLDRYFSAPSNIASVRSQPAGGNSEATDSPAVPE